MGKKDKRKNNSSNPQQRHHFEGRDGLLRMNFLLQAANLVTSTDACSSIPPYTNRSKPDLISSMHADHSNPVTEAPQQPLIGTSLAQGQVDHTSTVNNDPKVSSDVKQQLFGVKKRKQSRFKLSHTTPFAGLGRYYAANLRRVSAKLVMRLDPQVKRGICKRCNSVFLPGITSTVETTNNPELLIVTRCIACGYHKNLPCRPNHELFAEKSQTTAT